MKALQVTQNGAPSEVLSLVDIDRPIAPAGHVSIKVSAGSLNFNDIDRCYGRRISIPTPPPFTLGMDVCGVVAGAGEGAEHWLGKRVIAITQGATGGLAEYAIAAADSVFEAPVSLNDAQATAFIMPFHTAYLALVRRAKLEAGETLLVHSGASSVGAAAIQIGKAIGVKVIATVSSQQKVDYCKSLGADLVINHQKENFSDTVLDFSDNIGANVILDLAGGDFVEPSWLCVALEGRYIAAGFADDEQNGFSGKPLRLSCAGNFSIIGVLMAWNSNLPAEVRRMGMNVFGRDVAEQVHNSLLALVDAEKIKPNLERTIDFDESKIAQALLDQENRKTIGRTVVVLNG